MQAAATVSISTIRLAIESLPSPTRLTRSAQIDSVLVEFAASARRSSGGKAGATSADRTPWIVIARSRNQLRVRWDRGGESWTGIHSAHRYAMCAGGARRLDRHAACIRGRGARSSTAAWQRRAAHSLRGGALDSLAATPPQPAIVGGGGVCLR